MLRIYSKLGFFGKMVLPLIVVILIGTAAQLAFISHRTSANTQEAAITSAKAAIEQFKILRAYYTEKVVKKVKGTSELSVGIEHENTPDMVPLPATMIHDLGERFSKSSSGVNLRLYSSFPFPNRKGRTLDAFAVEAIDYFKGEPDGVFTRASTTNGQATVRVAIADRMVNESCVGCHNSHPDSPFKNWKIGDVRGVLEIETPVQNQMLANFRMMREIGIANVAIAVVICLCVFFTVLHAIIRPVRDMTSRLETVVTKGTQRSDDLQQVSLRVSSASTEQASAIQESAASLDEITAISRTNAANVSESRTMADDSQRVARSGQAAVEKVVQAIRDISSNNERIMASMNDSNKSLEEIVTVIHEIDSKAKVINDIVFQTRLLSFNASVEAARAGEHGKGFSVVAEEIGTLASMSGGAAADIAKLLNASVEKVQAIVADTKSRMAALMTSGQTQTTHGVSVAGECDEVLREVVAKAQRVNEMMIAIESATSEQNKGINGISMAMVDLSKTTEENAKVSEETAAASGELTNLNHDLRNLIRELHYLVNGRTSSGD